ncbi:hypothetical protein Poly41_07940 [Novipirellula artificiosorum]|uniref:Uncharacterized protein n=1 Tax=Novipirellula artificiosorum TaxID=2528016 RepID=A0A5C6E3E9_9BACT|nr:hypothetical protein Poly41_07940 [Novipirellula artificiosorum]
MNPRAGYTVKGTRSRTLARLPERFRIVFDRVFYDALGGSVPRHLLLHRAVLERCPSKWLPNVEQWLAGVSIFFTEIRFLVWQNMLSFSFDLMGMNDGPHHRTFDALRPQLATTV